MQEISPTTTAILHFSFSMNQLLLHNFDHAFNGFKSLAAYFISRPQIICTSQMWTIVFIVRLFLLKCDTFKLKFPIPLNTLASVTADLFMVLRDSGRLYEFSSGSLARIQKNLFRVVMACQNSAGLKKEILSDLDYSLGHMSSIVLHNGSLWLSSWAASSSHDSYEGSYRPQPPSGLIAPASSSSNYGYFPQPTLRQEYSQHSHSDGQTDSDDDSSNHNAPPVYRPVDVTHLSGKAIPAPSPLKRDHSANLFDEIFDDLDAYSPAPQLLGPGKTLSDSSMVAVPLLSRQTSWGNVSVPSNYSHNTAPLVPDPAIIPTNRVVLLPEFLDQWIDELSQINFETSYSASGGAGGAGLSGFTWYEVLGSDCAPFN